MPWETYLRQPFYVRWMMRDELADLIPQGDDGDAPPPVRPKRFRK